MQQQLQQQKQQTSAKTTHPFIQQIMQQQQQQQQQQQPQQPQRPQNASTGGVRRSNNGSVTQFKVPVEPSVSAASASSTESVSALLAKVEILEEKMVLFENLFTSQVLEIAKLRDELEISSIGTLKIRVIDALDVFEDRSETSEPVETLTAGSVLKVSYPFEENEEGLWAAKQVVELTDKGLMLTGRYFLLAARISEEIFSPKVSIIYNPV